MRRFLALLLAASVSGCATSHLGGPAAPDSLAAAASFSVQRDIVFSAPAAPEALKADLYVPEGPGPFPAVVVVHGGGWIKGQRSEMDRICRQLAGHGLVAVNIDYRLAPAQIFPAPLQDLQQAMRWVHAHAADYRIDDRHIGAWGYSAGAELVSLLGTLGPGDPNFAEGTRPQAVVSGGTPADLRFASSSPLVHQYLGGTLEQRPQAYRDASPLAFVSPDDPPMFFYHGGLDWVVGDINARRMKQELDRAGVPAELYLVHGIGHIGVFLGGYGVEAGVGFLQRKLR